LDETHRSKKEFIGITTKCRLDLSPKKEITWTLGGHREGETRAGKTTAPRGDRTIGQGSGFPDPEVEIRWKGKSDEALKALNRGE